LRISEVLFRETTTLGVRLSRRRRVKLSRRTCEVETSLGRIQAKWVEGPCLDGPEVRPEYEACRKVAEEKGLPLRKVYDQVMRATQSSLHEDRPKKKRKKGK
jgi:pyridinium-3,5-bisthiocarboxylic acid mononucleotide nickel chelatase